MSYCTTSDVTSLLKGLTFSASTKITTTEISDWITDESAVIDAKLVRKYSVPITDTEGLLVVKVICQKKVAARILEITYAGSNKDIPEAAKRWRDDAKDMLADMLADRLNINNEDTSDLTFTGKTDIDGNDLLANAKIGDVF